MIFILVGVFACAWTRAPRTSRTPCETTNDTWNIYINLRGKTTKGAELVIESMNRSVEALLDRIDIYRHTVRTKSLS